MCNVCSLQMSRNLLCDMCRCIKPKLVHKILINGDWRRGRWWRRWKRWHGASWWQWCSLRSELRPGVRSTSKKRTLNQRFNWNFPARARDSASVRNLFNIVPAARVCCKLRGLTVRLDCVDRCNVLQSRLLHVVLKKAISAYFICRSFFLYSQLSLDLRRVLWCFRSQLPHCVYPLVLYMHTTITVLSQMRWYTFQPHTVEYPNVEHPDMLHAVCTYTHSRSLLLSLCACVRAWLCLSLCLRALIKSVSCSQ